MAITPIGPRVLLQPKKKEEKTASGIYLPESAQEQKKTGTVVAVGTDKHGKDLPLSKGDTVMYGGYSNEEFTVEGNEYIVVDFKDIVAKLE